MGTPYVMQDWENLPSVDTPINADEADLTTNLEHVERGIYDAHWNAVHTAVADADVPATLVGHSGAQAGDLLQALKQAAGSVVTRIGKNGGIGVALAASDVGLSIQAAASQNTDIEQIKSGAGVNYRRVLNDGKTQFEGGGGVILVTSTGYTVKGQVVAAGTAVGKWNEQGDFTLGQECQDYTSATPQSDDNFRYATFAVLSRRGIIVTRSLRIYEPGDAVDNRRFRGGDASGHSPARIPGTRATTGIGTDSWGASWYAYGVDPDATPLADGTWPNDQWNSGGMSVKLAEHAQEFGAVGSGIIQAGGDMLFFLHPVTVQASSPAIAVDADAALNQFQTTGYTVSAVNTTTGEMTTSAAHNRQVGDKVVFSSTGAVPTNLVAGTQYFVVNVGSSTKLKVSGTAGGATIVPSDSGTGTVTVRPTHGYTLDDRIVFAYSSAPTPIVAGTVYYVINVGSSTQYKVSATKGGAVVDITAVGSGVTSHVEGVDTATNTLYFTTPHAFVGLSKIVFQTTGTMPAPLTAGTVYWVVSATVGEDSLQVSATKGGAAIDLTTTGAGKLLAHTGSGLQDSSHGIESAFLFHNRGAFAVEGRRFIQDKSDVANLTYPSVDRGDGVFDGRVHVGAGIVFLGEDASPPGDADVGANKCILYLADNGAGKSRLMAQFDTGSAVVATQP